jgi:hypothetical protein
VANAVNFANLDPLSRKENFHLVKAFDDEAMRGTIDVVSDAVGLPPFK